LSNLCNNLVLIGFMGSGKTALGKWISQNASMEFYDTDEYIVSKQNREIAEIFATDGEKYFRDLETEAIKEMNEKFTNSVISVGGGLPLREENRELLKSLGVIIYLRTTEDTLVQRLNNDTKRPLLAGNDIKAKIHDLLMQRGLVYESIAQIIVDTDDRTYDQIYNEIEDIILAKRNTQGGKKDEIISDKWT